MTDPMLFPTRPWPSVAVIGESARYPVQRIFCVGRNYAEHAAEMGAEVDREAPFYFTKSPTALLEAGGTLAYPPGSRDVHHEVELVVALGAPAFQIDAAAAMGCVYGYAVGLDMTRRDLQAVAKDKRRPWDLGKDGEGMAVIGPITPAAVFGAPGDQPITLTLDGAPRQRGRLSDMVWSVPELIADLSRFYHLGPGDLIYTGTPAGVGPVQPGSVLRGEIEGLAPLDLTIGPPDAA